MGIQLKVVEGNPRGKTIPLNGPSFVIGRDPDCHLRPKDESVGSRHCSLTFDGHRVAIRDLGSTSGTLLNGRRLKPAEVILAHDGDRLQVGPLVFEVHIEGDRVAAAAVARPAPTAQPFDGPDPDAVDPHSLDDANEVSAAARLANQLIQREMGRGPDPLKAVGTHLSIQVVDGVPCVSIEVAHLISEGLNAVRKELGNLAERTGYSRVVLDFHRVRDACPDAGNVLLAFRDRLKARGVRLKLCEMAPAVLDTLETQGVLDQIPVHLDRHDAVWSSW